MAQLLTGKGAIITGATRGFGKAIALHLAKEGVRIGLLAKAESTLKEVATEIESYGVKAAYATADFSS